MDWIESIKEIQKARETNRLVIFVGAGVSKNSNIPTWKGLIDKIALKIDYNERCIDCSEKKEDCPKDDCEIRLNFTSDEYLKIPEYYYLKDSSRGKREYYKLIKDTLKNDGISNPIDDEIIRILPHHIITTNYDPLLENSKELNTHLYTVVSQDSELLAKAKERYIVKMHGDMSNTKTIVLKESDYISYEQNHTLISTFIKSLLINHTFLFLGYSLNDNNLNLIIGWINYFCNLYGISERPVNFLIQPHTPSNFEKSRLESKNIQIISLDTLPQNFEDNFDIPSRLTDEVGKKLLSYLKCITDTSVLQKYIPLGDLLSEKYSLLSDYNKISYNDLISVFPLGRTEFKGNTLVLYEKQWYDSLLEVINEQNPIVIDTFRRADIREIYCYENDNRKEITDIYFDDIMQLYLDNEYVKLATKILTRTTAEKIYYFRLLNINVSEIEDLIKQQDEELKTDRYIPLLLHKMRSRLATLSWMNRQKARTDELNLLFNSTNYTQEKSYGYLKQLFQSSSFNHIKMQELLSKQEERYENINTIYSGHSYEKIWSLQSYAYDYYFFHKKNFLPIEYFSEPKEYFSYYLKAILCSYTPIKTMGNTPFGIGTDRRPYVLNEIDVDMIIQFTTPKLLKQWMTNYSVQYIKIDEGVDIVNKFINYCHSYTMLQHHTWGEQLLCFVIFLTHLELDDKDKNAILAAFSKMVKAKLNKSSASIIDLFDSIECFLDYFLDDTCIEEKSTIINSMFLPDVYKILQERYKNKFDVIQNKLSCYIYDATKEKIVCDIDSTCDIGGKCKKIFNYRKIVLTDKHKKYICKHIDKLSYDMIFYLLIEKTLDFNSIV